MSKKAKKTKKVKKVKNIESGATIISVTDDVEEAEVVHRIVLFEIEIPDKPRAIQIDVYVNYVECMDGSKWHDLRNVHGLDWAGPDEEYFNKHSDDVFDLVKDWLDKEGIEFNEMPSCEI